DARAVSAVSDGGQRKRGVTQWNAKLGNSTCSCRKPERIVLRFPLPRRYNVRCIEIPKSGEEHSGLHETDLLLRLLVWAVPVPADMGATGCRSSSFFLPLHLSILFLAFMTHCLLATDTLSLGQSLSGSQTLISNDGRFELGFFSPGLSRNYYMGIWFKKVPEQTVVWVANRETPLPDASSQLKISEQDGNLVLVNRINIPAWSSNSATKISNRTMAVLLDSGNLVLSDSSNSSIVIWQSFDYPTDTWLPGAKFGLNKITRLRQHLIAWKNSEDPAPGAYSIQIEADGTSRYFMLWNESRRYWSSGVWNGQKFPVLDNLGVRELGYLPRTFNFSYIANRNENSGIYSFEDNSTIARAVMVSSGQFQIWIWSKQTKKWVLTINLPRDQCEVYNHCGSFGVCNEKGSVPCTCLPGFRPLSSKDWEKGDWSGGCVREAALSCADNGSAVARSQQFLMVPNVQLPSDPQFSIVRGAKECQISCLDHCSCTAYAYNSSGCYKWIEDLLNLRGLSGRDVRGGLCLRLALQNRADKAGLIRVAVAGSIAIVVFVAVVILVRYWWRRRKLELDASRVVPGSLVAYRYRDLRIITHDFSEKLGGGSFGSVFKGTLPDTSLVAVKKLEGLGQGEKEFRSEVSTIGMIQHVNLVRLLGFCSEGSKRLLVYEFMPNGSLDSYLFEQNSRALDWKTRYQIVLEIAKGLAYLHEKCRECIVHCDIKPANILLDAAFCPKIADFGMAKLIGTDFSRVLTTMRGTVGYLAPEWIQGVAISAKADVYSYGMMTLEIVSGRRNTRTSAIADGRYFPLWAAGRIKEDDAIRLLDPRLEGNADIEEVNTVCRVAIWCIQDNEESRPSMGEVANILEGGFEVNLPPIPGFLQMLLDNQDMVKSDTCDQG
ncbi:hypothetical protein ACLOJK_021877, partial [Asimina triloba]